MLITDWPLPKGVHAWISRRDEDGVSQAPFAANNLAAHVGDDPLAVAANRQQLLRQLPSVRSIQWLNQVHSDIVLPATGSSVVPRADGCFSDQPGLACAVLTADCLPVLIAALDGSKVAAVHAGWRGLAAGIVLNALEQFSTPVTVYLGPAIGPDQFEVGPEVRDAFTHRQFGRAPVECFKAGNGDRLLADLYALARWQLVNAGVDGEQIFGGQHCTFSDPQAFYSYRRDPRCGRLASLIWRAK